MYLKNRLHLITITAGLILAFSVMFATAQTISVNSASSANNSLEKLLALRLIAAKTDDERAILFNDAFSIDKNVLAKEILDESDRQKGKASNAEIERIARIGLHFAELTGSKREIGLAWHAIGTAQTANSDKFASYKKGLEAANEASANDLVVKIIISIGQMQDTKEKEIDWYVKGIQNAERHPDKKVLSGLYGRIGNAYTQKGDYITARGYHARSLAIKEETNDLQGISISLSNIGIVDQNQGDNDASIMNLSRSVQISDSIGDKEGSGIDLYNLGNAYLTKGDYAQAMTHYARSLKLAEELNAGGIIEGVTTNIANLYIAQGNYELARTYLNRAALIADKTGKNIPQYALGSFGDSYKGEGNFEKAIGFYEKLLALKEKSENKDSLAETLINIGNCYLLIPNAEKARQHFERALKLTETTGSHVWSLRALLGLAESHLAQNDFRSAFENATRAKTHYEKLNVSKEYWELFTALGRASFGLGEIEKARLNFEKAIIIIETQRDRVAGSSSERQGFFRDKMLPYHLTTELLVSQGSFLQALKYVEMARARTLLETIGSGKVNIGASLTPQETAREQTYKNEMVSFRSQLENENRNAKPDRARLADLQSRLTKKRLEYEDFQNRLYVAHPDLKVQRGEIKPIGIAEAGGLLTDPKGALLEYVVDNDRTFLFVITRSPAGNPSLKAFTVDVKDKDLTKRVEAYRSKVAAGDLGFQRSSRELYDLLLKPAQAQLAGKTNIIIVPDGPLWDLPFQTLQDEKGKYLVENAAVSYAPSLTALKEMSKKAKLRKRDAGLELLAFGNPIVGKATADRVKQVFMSEKLEPIPEAERLVNELGKMYGPGRSKVYIGDQAREETAKTESPKYRIVQFATHGILNNVSPMYSHLVLAQNDKNPNEDGLLEAWEMKDLDLKADMVILSACETARGKISNGEGVIGMSWAMFIAGTPTTVASQWKVESKSTTELMLEFHRQMLNTKGISKAEALRRASLKVMKMPGFKHPSYWAGFVIVGDGS